MKKPIFIAITLGTILLMSLAFAKSYKSAASSSLLEANIAALTQNESPDQGEEGGAEGTTGNNYDYWVTTDTTEEFINDSNCCYRYIRTTEVDCLPDGQQDCSPKTHVEVFIRHRYHHV